MRTNSSEVVIDPLITAFLIVFSGFLPVGITG